MRDRHPAGDRGHGGAKLIGPPKLKGGRGRRTVTVMTNGVFDILHAGHVSLLEQAKAMGDHLFVAVNDNLSAEKLGKGPLRPLNDEVDRLRVISALRVVDTAFLFYGDTPEMVIRGIRPDYLVKGADYTVEEVVGHDFVGEWGGEVRLVPLLKGYSTTALVDAIQTQPKPQAES